MMYSLMVVIYLSSPQSMTLQKEYIGASHLTYAVCDEHRRVLWQVGDVIEDDHFIATYCIPEK